MGQVNTMFIILKKNLFLIILLSLIFVSASDEQQLKSEDICGITRSVLCVKDVLMIIATGAKNINRTANDIEKDIINNIQIVETLNRYVKLEMDFIDSDLPTSEYHEQFLQLNNIDTKYLGKLFLEAHSAMNFYYHSIDDLLNMTYVFTSTTDSWFKQIQFNLRNEILCRYRSILNAYSYEKPLINQVNRIQFSRRQYQNVRSLVRDVHSIVITRLLSKWMQRLHSTINDLEAKFF